MVVVAVLLLVIVAIAFFKVGALKSSGDRLSAYGLAFFLFCFGVWAIACGMRYRWTSALAAARKRPLVRPQEADAPSTPVSDELPILDYASVGSSVQAVGWARYLNEDVTLRWAVRLAYLLVIGFGCFALVVCLTSFVPFAGGPRQLTIGMGLAALAFFLFGALWFRYADRRTQFWTTFVTLSFYLGFFAAIVDPLWSWQSSRDPRSFISIATTIAGALLLGASIFKMGQLRQNAKA
jgi:hypothetical protein